MSACFHMASRTRKRAAESYRAKGGNLTGFKWILTDLQGSDGVGPALRGGI